MSDWLKIIWTFQQNICIVKSGNCQHRQAKLLQKGISQMKYDSKLLESLKDETIKLLNVIEDMLDGNEEDYACKKNDMRPQKFRSILAACLEKRSLAIDYTPEERLYEILFETVSYAAYPSDLDKTIPYCMEKFLDEQERDILKRIYWNNETFESVSTAYSTNSSNIKKIVRNALKKLRNEKAVKYIEFGLTYEDDLKKIRESSTSDGRSINALRLLDSLPKEAVLTHVQAAYLQKVMSLMEQLNTDYNEIYEDNSTNPVTDDEIEVTIEKCDAAPTPVQGMQIDGLNIPIRLKNSLKNNHINTIDDLMHYSLADLQQTRGIGRSMLRVLVTELDKLGIKLSS